MIPRRLARQGVLHLLGLNCWNGLEIRREEKMKVLPQVLTSSTQLQDSRLCHVVDIEGERLRNVQKIKLACAKREKRARLLFSIFIYVNCVTFLPPSSSNLLKLLNGFSGLLTFFNKDRD